MPCCTIATGQPPAGMTPPQAEVALGTVTSSGTVTVLVAAGAGLNIVRLRLAVSVNGAGGGPAAFQKLVRTAALAAAPVVVVAAVR